MATELVHLAELCEAAGVDGKRARARLRAAGVKKSKEGVWAWARGSAELAEVKRIISGRGESADQSESESASEKEAGDQESTHSQDRARTRPSGVTERVAVVRQTRRRP